MTFNPGLFLSTSPHWATPADLLAALSLEFGSFTDDPCPLHSQTDGLHRPWGERTFVNPPYGRAITAWVEKSLDESRQGKLVVCLLPCRTDTRWWHEYVMQATTIRFVRGRLRFGNSKTGAPFPSAIVIFDGRKARRDEAQQVMFE